MKVEIPEKLGFLFEPQRYKVLYGGRGGAKSWGIARTLIILALQKPMRILCAREFQKSISESVHKLLSDQIKVCIDMFGHQVVVSNKSYRWSIDNDEFIVFF